MADAQFSRNLTPQDLKIIKFQAYSLLAVKAGTSRVGHLSPSARKLHKHLGK